MSKFTHPLDNINITSPCTADWDSMIGNDVVRFCRHCNLNVHDISLMTGEEALALVRSSNGRLCLRYIRRPDGTIQTASPHQKLHLIKRRASRIVAASFGATLSICSGVAAQIPSPANKPEAGYEVPLKGASSTASVEGGVAVLLGTIFDPNRAIVPGARVTLTNESTKNVMSMETDDEGLYRFQSLTGGIYTLAAESPGFVSGEINHINVPGTGEQRFDISLEIRAVSGGLVVVNVEPREPLLKAVVEDNTAAVRELLASGANVNVVDEFYDSTALAEALARGNQEMVRILLGAGADTALKNRRGRTAILYLSERSTGELVRELVAAGAKINDRDEDGNTPLSNAAILNNAELVRAVIGAGANVNEQNEAGQTALMLAAREGHMENAQALLNCGADICMEDSDGWTALKYAQDNSHADMAELLKAYGAVK